MENLGFYFAKFLRRCNRAAVRASTIHKTSKVCSGSQINCINMGKYSYIGNNCFVNHAKVGSFCSVADNCFIGGAAHPINFVSSSPVFCKGRNILGKNFAEFRFDACAETIIGNDVWIGAGATVLSGRTIGDGAVIGAGSVVTKDVGDYEIWAGNPARFIRKRFDDETISQLKAIKWWDLSDEELKSIGELFDDPQKLMQYFKEGDR